MGKESKPIRFHPEVLSPLQGKILRRLGPLLRQQHFYLGGGTTIALYLGHHHSVDLDGFTAKGVIDSALWAQHLRDQGIPFTTGQIERGTLHGTISGVRVSFLEYRYPLVKPLIIWPQMNCPLASLEDLACMKLSALSQRGSKKDFIDIYALGLKHFRLREMLRFYQQKYSVKDVGHVLYGLSYFDDADQERLPKMFWDVSWTIIKKTIQGWVKDVAGFRTPPETDKTHQKQIT
ncbi:MAG: nucleotidyl transferase AbiEii/AbiGii toxin family protein [Syntrophaceae bacterium]|nr:nucleotidyl transferase AbiEii/AbiGii toxin family protein [Syntrophaceae bacterium]